MPKVSIIVPVYNAEKALRRCIESILTQEYGDFELLLMDDGSRDASGSICDEYAAKDARVRVTHKENSGVSATRNQALDLARGDYIQFLDADDWITADATKLFVRAMEENDCDMVISDFYRVVGERTSHKGDIDADGVITREEFADYMMKNPADYYYGVIWNKLFRRELIERYHLRMDVNLHWCEDYIFNMEYILHVRRVFALHVPVYYYVKTEGSLVAQGMNLPGIVQMKLNVIQYYSRFYKNIYSAEDYQRRRPEIYRFLIDYARDDAALPFLPGTKKLGSERVPLYTQGEIRPNVFTDVFFMRKLLDGYLYTIGQQYDLELRDVKIIVYLYYNGGLDNLKALADYAGCAPVTATAALEKLSFKGLVETELRLDGISARLTKEAAPIGKAIGQAGEDFDRVRFADLDEASRAAYAQGWEATVARARTLL